MHQIVLFIAALLAALASPPSHAPATTGGPRVLIVLEDSGAESSPERFARPALNYLGLTLECHDAAAPLPELGGRTDVRGVLIWLDRGTVGDAAGFAAWVRDLAQRGVPVVLMGKTPEAENRFDLFVSLGLFYTRDDRAYTYDLRAVDRDNDIVDFARHFDNLFPEADIVRPLDPGKAHIVLELQRRGDVTDRTHPLVVTPKGGYAADGYAIWTSPDGAVGRWYIDPVAFFRLALKIDAGPVPDPTVLNGRRVFSARAASAEGSAASKAAAIGLVEAVAASGGDLPLDIADDSDAVWNETAVPATAMACRQHSRALLVGFDGAGTALTAAGAPYPLKPFAPRFAVCADQAAALAAVHAVFAKARTVPLHPITTAQWEEIERGAESARLQPTGPRSWRIVDRGGLQTLRVDNAADQRVDWTVSNGVIGAARVEDRLYVSLDPASPAPTLVLTDAPWVAAPFPVSIESRWQISGLMRDVAQLRMTVEGFGPGDMSWAVAPRSNWEILFEAKGRVFRYRASADQAGVLAFSLPALARDPAILTLTLHAGGAP